MSEWLKAMGPAVANHLWQSTAFAVVAWGATLLLRRNQARVRYGVWLVASVKFLVPFALLIGLGGMLPRPQHTVVTMPVYSAVDEVGLPFSDVETMPVAANPTHDAVEPRHEWGTRMWREWGTWPVMLAVVWLCGSVVVLVVWCVRWRQVARVLRRAVAEPALAELGRGTRSGQGTGTRFGGEGQECGGREAELLRRVEPMVGARVRLVLSSDLMEPGIFGVFRPVLIWPERLSERLDDEHIEAILAHELMHVRRRDNLAAAIHMLVEAAFWFHPLVWWIQRRMVEERERACDEAVVELGSRPGVYAESLLKAVRFCVESPLVCVAGVTGADLSKRVRSIMTLRLRKLGVAGKIALATLAIATIAVPVAFGVVRMIPMVGQVFQATGPLPSYEFVVIKPSREEAHGASTEGDTTHYGVTAKMLVQFAYSKFGPTPSIIDLKVVGGPDWINNDVFSIVGKMSSAEYQQEQDMGREQRLERRQMMEQSILADRYKLKMHTEMQDQPVYALTVTKPGKLAPAKDATGTFRFNPFPSDAAPESITRGLVVNRVGGHLKLTAKGMSIVELINALASQRETNGEHVVDQTGLTGAYDFTLTWGPPDNAVTAESNDAESPPLFTAIQQQLGLKLVSSKAPAQVVVIDHIEKPVFDSADAVAKPSVVATVFTEGQRMLARLVPAALMQAGAEDSPKPSVNGEPDIEGKPLKFDVVSVRPSAPGESAASAGRRRRVPMLFTDDGLSIQNVSLHYLLMIAYEASLLQGRILNAPDWVDAQNWSIEAKVADSDVPAYSQIAHDKTPEGNHRRALMLRALLAERFKLKAHLETREGAVFLLEVAKGGVKAKQVSPNDPRNAPDASGRVPLPGVARFVVGPGHVDLPDAPVGELVIGFTGQLGVPVIDKTGLTGRYDLKLDWQPDTGASAAPNASDSAKPSLYTAMEEQLGLKLVPGKAPLPVLVIDHVEKASVDGAEVQANPPKQSLDGAPGSDGQKQVLHGVYKTWLEQDVRWIITAEEAEAFRHLMNDEERDRFIEQFWLRRSPDPGESGNAYREEIYARIAYANEHFAGDEPGWMTDRGHVYIVYGKPDDVSSQPGSAETWHYGHIPGVGDNIVLKFTFVGGLGRYRLVPPVPAGLFWDGMQSEVIQPAAGAETPNPLKRRLTDAERVGEAGQADPSRQRLVGVAVVDAHRQSTPAFDVVSIHLSAPSPDGHHHIYNDVHQSQLRTGNLSIRDLMQFAYALPKSQILGGPDWLDSTMFDIDAKSDPAVDAQLRAMSSDEAARQKRLMVQALLSDRFALAAHNETRELPVFALILAKGGPKFKPSQINGTTIDTYPSRLHISGSDDTVAILARELAQSLGRIVLDQTGLTGRYDLTLRWTPDDRPAPMLNGAPDPNAPPDIFTAIQEQLGLKLESTKGPVPVLVVDHVEEPSEN